MSQKRSKGLLDLPEPVLDEIISRLNLRDTFALSCTSKRALKIVSDQHCWRQRLWHWGKILNVCMVNCSSSRLKEASAIVSDPLLLNLRTLYYVLSPCGCSLNVNNTPIIDMGNLLSKADLSSTSRNYLNQFYDLMNRMWKLYPRQYINDHAKFSYRFLLFSSPENRHIRWVMLSLLASRSNFLETVGLVNGKPGGVGSGVTVRYEAVVEHSNASEEFRQHEFNLIPLRQMSPRLFTKDCANFIPDVIEVVHSVDGLICVLDAHCHCADSKWTPPAHSTLIDGHYLELVELNAVLRTIPSNKCPMVLIFLVHRSPRIKSLSADDARAPADGFKPTPECAGALFHHRPYLLQQVMAPFHLPWAAFEVETNSLCGLHLGLNWLLRRTVTPPASVSHSFHVSDEDIYVDGELLDEENANNCLSVE